MTCTDNDFSHCESPLLPPGLSPGRIHRGTEDIIAGPLVPVALVLEIYPSAACDTGVMREDGVVHHISAAFTAPRL